MPHDVHTHDLNGNDIGGISGGTLGALIHQLYKEKGDNIVSKKKLDCSVRLFT
jgi:hypothetical protein